ncbi:proline dehydrogenase family protein [Daejeonella sp. JGW-45]|uniref:proline dehydrogenase family protein n=1 Tax=Daejeonella sp. JGW-45 TaxID=3034148 RepID=UPI0023ED184C|nr:proline dehydrogenase family protein [Daejeonella sp. JGW-45]
MHNPDANQLRPSNGSPDFDNTEIAFRGKSNSDLRRAYWLFKIISVRLLTTIGPPLTRFAMFIHLPIKPLIKATIFKHFCGGETIEECEATISQLHKGRVGSILDYSVEGEDDEKAFEATCEEIVNTINRADGDARIPLTVFKVTGLGRFDLIAKRDARGALNEAEKAEFGRVSNRINRICSLAHEKSVRVMIDAEETWIQDSIDELALEMMRRYNQNQPIVYNTYQLYRSNVLECLKEDTKLAFTEGFILGAKLVRGAYMEKERKRAIEMAYPSPINATKEETDQDYNDALRFCVSHLNTLAFVAGTHNEESCRLLAELLDKKKIKHDHDHVYFSQLLGMSDNLSFNLAASGYNVAKYVPYGPVKAVMPYLFRRAEENTSVAGQMGRELKLIVKEQRRRSPRKRGTSIPRP